MDAPNRYRSATRSASRRMPPLKPLTAIAGWTLTELLVVMAIMGLLSAMAWPSYTQHVQRGHRAEAAAALMEAQNFMERYYSAHGRYSAGTSTEPAGGMPSAPELPPRLQNIPAQAPRYVLSVSQVSASSYTLSAVPTGSMVSDKCATLTLSHTLQRGSSNPAVSANDCWR